MEGKNHVEEANATDDKEAVKAELEAKLKKLTAEKHRLVQMLKQVLHLITQYFPCLHFISNLVLFALKDFLNYLMQTHLHRPQNSKNLKHMPLLESPTIRVLY